MECQVQAQYDYTSLQSDSTARKVKATSNCIQKGTMMLNREAVVFIAMGQRLGMFQ